MKVILTGATGVVGTECVRLALKHPQITEVVALSRRPVSVPDSISSEAAKSKLKTVILEDFASDYPEAVKQELKDADACIWNLAITPPKAKELTPEEVRKICHDYPLYGVKSMASVANSSHPFRFVYISGGLVERDQNKSLWFAADYRKMRGAVDSALLSHAATTDGKVEVQITKPNLIDHSERSMLARAAATGIAALSSGMSINVSELAAAEVDQAVNGFAGKDTLENADLVAIGQAALTQLGVEKD